MYPLLLSWRTHELPALLKGLTNTGGTMSSPLCQVICGSQLQMLTNVMRIPVQKCLVRSFHQKTAKIVLQRFLPFSICSSKPLHICNLFPCNESECDIQFSARNYCSALFITSDKLSQLCSNVAPAYDIVKVLENKENVRQNLKRRQLNSIRYDFAQIQEYYEKFVSVEKALTELEYKAIEVEDYLIRNRSKMDHDQIEMKTQERSDLKAEIRKFDDFLLEFQKNVIINILKLPNDLDSNTPDVYETIYQYDPESVKNQGNKSDSFDRLRDHVKFTNKLDIHYLGTAAKFEYLFPIILKDFFISKHKFIPFTNTDLCKGVIVEGTGTPYLSPYDNIVLVNNEMELGEIGYDERRYHLVGSAHTSMFCAYHTNHSVSVKDLPVKYIASGKRYGFQNLIPDLDRKIPKELSRVENLYNGVQKENVTLFIGTCNRESSLKELDKQDFLFKSFFRHLNIQYRICRTPATRLHPSESARIEYQLFSNCLNSWVTCVDACLTDDYISKRLRMCHHTSVTSYEKQYLHLLNVNVHVNVLLVNLIERGETLAVEVLRKSLATM